MVFGCTSISLTGQEEVPVKEIVAEHEHEDGTPEEHSHEPVTMKVILIEDFSFSPQELTIEAESGVTWVNRDEDSHSIKLDTFNSEELAKNDFYTFTFNDVGIYEFSCGVHPNMQGKIIVTQREFPVVKKAPNFELINQDSEKISLDQFPGKLKVLSFFYVGCTAENGCSLTTNNFMNLQGLLGEELSKKTVLLLITVNPENDIPEILKEYGELYGADFSNWHFLTGDSQVVEKVLDDYDIVIEKQEQEDEDQVSDNGFPTVVGAFSGINLIHGDDEDDEVDILHSMLTFLIDQNNNVRQVYISNMREPEGIKKDIITLLDE